MVRRGGARGFGGPVGGLRLPHWGTRRCPRARRCLGFRWSGGRWGLGRPGRWSARVRKLRARCGVPGAAVLGVSVVRCAVAPTGERADVLVRVARKPRARCDVPGRGGARGLVGQVGGWVLSARLDWAGGRVVACSEAGFRRVVHKPHPRRCVGCSGSRWSGGRWGLGRPRRWSARGAQAETPAVCRMRQCSGLGQVGGRVVAAVSSGLWLPRAGGFARVVRKPSPRRCVAAMLGVSAVRSVAAPCPPCLPSRLDCAVAHW